MYTFASTFLQSDVNKMHVSIIAIVFCPMLQLSAPLFHLIYNNAQELLGEVELKKWDDHWLRNRDIQVFILMCTMYI